MENFTHYFNQFTKREIIEALKEAHYKDYIIDEQTAIFLNFAFKQRLVHQAICKATFKTNSNFKYTDINQIEIENLKGTEYWLNYYLGETIKPNDYSLKYDDYNTKKLVLTF